ASFNNSLTCELEATSSRPSCACAVAEYEARDSGELLNRLHRALLTKCAPQHLSDRRFRQLAAKLHVTWNLIAGQMIAAMRDQLVGRESGLPLHDHEFYGLTRLGIRHPDDP